MAVVLTSLALKNGVKNIQTAGYNGARTVNTNSKTQNVEEVSLLLGAK